MLDDRREARTWFTASLRVLCLAAMLGAFAHHAFASELEKEAEFARLITQEAQKCQNEDVSWEACSESLISLCQKEDVSWEACSESLTSHSKLMSEAQLNSTQKCILKDSLNCFGKNSAVQTKAAAVPASLVPVTPGSPTFYEVNSATQLWSLVK